MPWFIRLLLFFLEHFLLDILFSDIWTNFVRCPLARFRRLKTPTRCV